MILEQIASGGCRSYLLGCDDNRKAVLIDPVIEQMDQPLGLAARHGLSLQYLVDTHTHADHVSASAQLARKLSIPVVMHPLSVAPYAELRVGDREILGVGHIRLQVLHTPGHTHDSLCLWVDDMVFTGDTLLVGGTGRTDLPTGDPAALFDSLFDILLKLPPETRVFPGHEYHGRPPTTIGEERLSNPRLQRRRKAEFIDMMNSLNLPAPDRLAEALRTNMSGGKTVAQLIAEASAAIAFISARDLQTGLQGEAPGYIVLDVREKDAYQSGHIPGARHLPRGELELRVNTELQEPNRTLVVVCETGALAILAAATLRTLGFSRAIALDGGMAGWREGTSSDAAESQAG